MQPGSAALPRWPERRLCSSSLGLRHALRLHLAFPLHYSLGADPLRQLCGPRDAIPLLEGLRRDFALDQQLGKLPALRFALDWHFCKVLSKLVERLKRTGTHTRIEDPHLGVTLF